MCLALLATAGSIVVDLMCEQMWLKIVNGDIAATEVYDIFFKLKVPTKKLLAHSPHILGDHQRIDVRAEDAPGSDAGYDDYYSKLGKAQFDPGTKDFSIQIEQASTTYPLRPEKYSGEVVAPAIALPDSIKNNLGAHQLSERCGTVIEMDVSSLTVGKSYFMRLKVEPRHFNLPKTLINVPDPATLTEGPQWERSVQLLNAQTVYESCLQMLQSACDIPKDKNIAMKWRTVLEEKSLQCCQILRHRLALVIPNEASLEREHTTGAVMRIGSSVVSSSADPVPRSVFEWEGGSETFWIEHPRSVADAIYKYLEKWSQKEHKTKEDITSALGAGGLSHRNTGLVVDALMRHGAVAKDDMAKYYALSIQNRVALLDAIGTDGTLLDKFNYPPFEIAYTVRFAHRSKAFTDKLELAEKKRAKIDALARKSYIWAIWGVALALVGILIAVWGLWLTIRH